MQRNKLFTLVNCAFVAGAFFSAELMALPSVDHVASGDVNFTQSAGAAGNALTVTQNSDKAIVNWNSFNINAGDGVHFQQPDGGVCLNRIDATSGMSHINGNLSATGTIFLINQAGVVFGKTAKVDVGGIIASTADITDENFHSDGFFFKEYKFDQASQIDGSIINKGIINVAEGGFAALVGASVSNEGVIKAKASNIQLASGRKFTLDFWGSELISVAIDAPTLKAGVDENDKSLAHGVNNSGQIISEAGAVFLTGKAAQGVFDQVVNMDGAIRATTIEQYDGVIALRAENGNVKVTGTLDSSGVNSDSEGAGIVILGDNIVIDGNAELNASADAGNSFIAVGWQDDFLAGKEDDVELGNTSNVYIGPRVTLAANAKSNNAGTIIIGGETSTFLGSAQARGLDNAAGGKVLINGSKAAPRADVSAENGNHGDVVFADDAKVSALVNQWFMRFDE